MNEKAEKGSDWREVVSKDLEYYFDTEEGRKKLEEMVKAEAKAILEQIAKRPRVDWIIWLSKHCENCVHFSLSHKGIMKCMKHDAKIVKPFYGKPKWKIVAAQDGEDYVIDEIEWGEKAFDIADLMVEEAVKKVNRGLPYFCFEAKV